MAKYRMIRSVNKDRYAQSALMLYGLQSLLFVFNPQNTALFYDVLSALFCLPLVFVTWWIKEKTPLCAKILTTVTLLLTSFAPCFLPSRIVMLVYLLSFVVLLLSLAFCYVTEKKVKMNGMSWFMQLIYLYFVLVFSISNYSASFSFWKFSLVFGIAVGAVATAKWFWKKSRFWVRVGYFVLISFLAFFLVLAYSVHLNYVLDFDEPQEHVLVIAGKDIDRHRKGPNTYQFEFTVDGNDFELEVHRTEYNAYAVGDTYRVLQYGGAFNQSFYISGEHLE